MPLVTVRYKPKVSANENWPVFKKRLRSIVSSGFTESGNILNPEDIETEFKPFGPDDESEHSLGIRVLVNKYPKRMAYLEQIREAIQKEVSSLLPEIKNQDGYVWVLLADGSFGEFG